MTATGQGNANRGMWIGLALLKIPQSQPVGVVSAAHFNFSLLHIPVCRARCSERQDEHFDRGEVS